MGKLFETLRRTPDQVGARLTNVSGPSSSLRVAPDLIDDNSLGNSADVTPGWPPLFDGRVVPFVEVPDLDRRANASPSPAPAIVPFPHADGESVPGTSGRAPTLRPTPSQHADEAYRQIARTLLQELPGNQPKSLLLLPLETPQGLAECAVELSGAFVSEVRQPVLLVDILRHDDGVARRLQVAAAPGWEELLLGLEWTLAIQRSRVPGLDVIVAGNRLAHATSARWAQEAGRQLRSLGELYRFLLVTSPPWPGSTLGLLLAGETQATCLVVPDRSMDGAAHLQLLEQLNSDGRKVLGSLVMN